MLAILKELHETVPTEDELSTAQFAMDAARAAERTELGGASFEDARHREMSSAISTTSAVTQSGQARGRVDVANTAVPAHLLEPVVGCTVKGLVKVGSIRQSAHVLAELQARGMNPHSDSSLQKDGGQPDYRKMCARLKVIAEETDDPSDGPKGYLRPRRALEPDADDEDEQNATDDTTTADAVHMWTTATTAPGRLIMSSREPDSVPQPEPPPPPACSSP